MTKSYPIYIKLADHASSVGRSVSLSVSVPSVRSVRRSVRLSVGGLDGLFLFNIDSLLKRKIHATNNVKHKTTLNLFESGADKQSKIVCNGLSTMHH